MTARNYCKSHETRSLLLGHVDKENSCIWGSDKYRTNSQKTSSSKGRIIVAEHRVTSKAVDYQLAGTSRNLTGVDNVYT